MPKEFINFPTPGVADTLEPGGPIVDVPAPPQVGVHWDGRHEMVQLSLDIDSATLEEIVRLKKENPELWDGSEAGRQIFYTGPLDRADLQRLIKAARRARDAAFGADE